MGSLFYTLQGYLSQNHKYLRLFGLNFLFIVFLSLYFSSEVTQAQDDKYGDAIIVASSTDARTLIPILASDSASSQVCGLIFNGLIKYDKNLNIIGDLAQSWKVSEDGLTITFYLRKDVFWQDGRQFTAKDVEFTYNKIMDPQVACPYIGDFQIIDKLEILDDFTIKITYKEPFSPALSSWGMSIIPEHILHSQDLRKTEFQRNPIGTGPYRLKRWKTQEKIELNYYNKYFEGRPNISRYIYKIIPDDASTFLELQTKAIDYTGISPLAFQFKTNTKFFQDNFNKFQLPSFSYTYLGYNLSSPLFKDNKVRVALDHAVNKEEIMKVLFFGLARPITGPFIIDSWAYDHEIMPRKFNPELAKTLLSEAGWKDIDQDGILEKAGTKFEFTITTNQGNEQRIKTAEIIQKRLKDIGIKVKIKVLEWSVFLSECVEKRNFDTVLLGWSLSLDPDPFDIWHSSKTKEGEFNFVGYKNKEVDNLIIQGRREFEQQKRKEIYQKIHKFIFDDQPYMFLYSPEALLIIDKRFQGLDPGPAGIGYNFIKWWVDKNKQRYKDIIQE